MDAALPDEFHGASLYVLHAKSKPVVVIAHGSSIIQITEKATRVYDVESKARAAPYVRAVLKKLLESPESNRMVQTYTYTRSDPPISLSSYLAGAGASASGTTVPTSIQNIGPDAPWNVEVLKADTTEQSDADSLMDMISSPTYSPGPATDMGMHTRGVESPTTTSIAPHRRSVIKGLRDPKTYLASLLR
jgi:hypothetical protein